MWQVAPQVTRRIPKVGLGLGAVATFGAGMVHISAVVQGFKTLRDFFRGFT